jgi:MHS family proline/betaine transporter-like MFS transporter
MNRKFIFPAIVGTVVEYYDYALYGFSADLIASHFFQSSDPSFELLKAYGIFIVGSCSKPLGSIVFGHLGDKYGRSFSLKISMAGITIPTVLVGLMPGYELFGGWAAIGLLICRFLQGIFVSGESDGVRIFMYESLGKQYRCLSNSLSGMACMFGIYIASLASNLTHDPALPEYAWRLPFLAGGLLGIGVIIGRQFITETPEYTEYVNDKISQIQTEKQLGWLTVMFENKHAIFTTFLLCGVVGGGYHFYFIFFPKYLSAILDILEPKAASILSSQSILVYTVCVPIAGWAADRFTPLTILKVSAVALVVTVSLNIIMIFQGILPTWVWMLTTLNLAFFHTPGFVVLLEKFSVGERFRCVSIGHALGSVVLSGTAPFLSLWIWTITGQTTSPLWYMLVLTLLGIIAVRRCAQRIEKKSVGVNTALFVN